MLMKSNQIMLCLFILAFFVLILGPYTTSAANATEHSTGIVKENFQKENTAKIETPKKIQSVKTNQTSQTSITKKTQSKEVKKSPQLEPIELYTEDVECNYGDVVELSVTTQPEGVDDGIITWFIDEDVVGVRNLSRTSGNYELDTSDYEPGVHEILVDYGVSNTYDNANARSTLTINKIETSITNLQYEFNDENKIKVNYNIEANDEYLDFGKLNVYYEDSPISTQNISSENPSLIIDSIYNEEILTFEYVGNRYYANVTSEELLYLDKLDLSIYLPYMTGYQSSQINQTVTFNTNRMINDGRLGLYIDGVLINQYDVSSKNLTLSVNLENFEVGSYPVYIEYTGSKVYQDAGYLTTLKVNEIKTTLYTYNITAHKNEEITIRSYVYNYVGETDEGLLEFFLDDESIETRIVNNSRTNITYLIPNAISYGQHQIRVVYYGTQKYSPSEATAVLDVVKYQNTISIRNYTLNDEGQIVLNVNSYSYNQTVDSGEIRYYVNGSYVSTVNVTSNNTQITLPPEYEAGNDYEIRLEYSNSDKFNDSTLTNTISPDKIETSIRIYKNVNNKNILNITTYVYAGNYQQLNEGIVEFYLNNTLIDRANVKNNTANITYNMTGKIDSIYEIKTLYVGTKVYENSQNTTTLDYITHKDPIYIRTNSTINALPGDDIQINATITDYEENIIGDDFEAQIIINNEEINTTIHNGRLSFNHTLTDQMPEGNYDIVIQIPETTYYTSTNKTVKLTITKDATYITATNKITATKGETITVNATLNSNGEKINENIMAIVKIGNKTIYQGYFINGTLKYKIKTSDKYTNDSYLLTIKSKESRQYREAIKTINLTLEQRKTYIVSKDIYTKSGNKIIIQATVYDLLTRKAVNSTSEACIKVNNVTIKNMQISNGKILHAYINNYSSEKYNLTIKFGGNDIYESSQWDGNIYLNKTEIKITTNNINTKSHKTINIKANLYENNKLATGEINAIIKINDITISSQTVTDGKINCNYTLPDHIGSGTYTITIKTGETGKYYNASTNAKLIVTKNYKYINTTNIKTKVNETINIKAQLLDEEGKLINKTTGCCVKIDGITIENLNVTDGLINFNYTLPENMKAGNYTMLFKAAESTGYMHATKTVVLEVEES